MHPSRPRRLACVLETLEGRRLLSAPLMLQTLGTWSSTIVGYAEHNAKLYVLTGGGEDFKQLWLSDGSVAGTDLVHTFDHTGAPEGTPTIAVVNDKLLVGACDAVLGFRLWTVDGTSMEDITPVSSLVFGGITPAGNYGYLYAADSKHGTELWRTDGSRDGTILLGDLNPGPGDGVTYEGTCIGGTFYFAGHSPTSGTELWKTDGTPAGTVLVKDLVPGSGSSSPTKLVGLDGKLVFASHSDLYVSDGTSVGTRLLYSFDEGQVDDYTTLSNGTLLFTAAGQGKGNELWRTDGTPAGTVLVKDIIFGPENSHPDFGGTNQSGTVALFSPLNSSGELWRTDGTAAGTWLVKDLNPEISSDFVRLVYVDGASTYLKAMYFDASADSYTLQLWKTDGSTTGTVKLGEWQTANYAHDITMRRHLGEDRLYFVNYTTSTGRELWTTDATPAGTQLLEDLNPGAANGVVSLIDVEVGSSQLFLGNRGDGIRIFTAGTGGITADSPVALVVGATEGDDVITVGYSGDQVIYTINGDNTNVAANEISSITIDGLAGDDSITIDASLGRGVTIFGGAGNDTLIGGSFADLIYGGDGDDQILGNDGVDTIYGNFGNDVIAGGLKRDSLMGGLGEDTITAGDGPDSVFGGDGRDLLRGGKGADLIEGRGKADTIYGGEGNDSVWGGAGADGIYGEDGDDRIDVGASAVFRDSVDGGLGYDLGLYDEDDVITGVEGLLI